MERWSSLLAGSQKLAGTQQSASSIVTRCSDRHKALHKMLVTPRAPTRQLEAASRLQCPSVCQVTETESSINKILDSWTCSGVSQRKQRCSQNTVMLKIKRPEINFSTLGHINSKKMMSLTHSYLINVLDLIDATSLFFRWGELTF